MDLKKNFHSSFVFIIE